MKILGKIHLSVNVDSTIEVRHAKNKEGNHSVTIDARDARLIYHEDCNQIEVYDGDADPFFLTDFSTPQMIHAGSITFMIEDNLISICDADKIHNIPRVGREWSPDEARYVASIAKVLED